MTGLRIRKRPVKVQQVPHIRAAPDVNRLIRISHYEQIAVVSAQNAHQLVLRLVDILKFVDHNIFQSTLPLDADLLILLKNVQDKFDEIIVIQSEALFFLIEIAVENDILRFFRFEILPDQVSVIFRFAIELSYLDHISGFAECHIPERQAPLFIDDFQHGVDVGIVQHKKAFRVLRRVAVFLKNRNAETVECIDISGVIVPGQIVDALSHFVCGFVRKCDA